MATPPPPEPHDLDQDRVVATVAAWEGLVPLAAWSRVAAELAPERSGDRVALTLDLQPPPALSPSGSVYQVRVRIDVDLDGAPVDTPEVRRRLAELPGLVASAIGAAEADESVRAWLRCFGGDPGRFRGAAAGAAGLTWSGPVASGPSGERLGVHALSWSDGLRTVTIGGGEPDLGLARTLREAVAGWCDGASIGFARLVAVGSGRRWQATGSAVVGGQSVERFRAEADEGGAWRVE